MSDDYVPGETEEFDYTAADRTTAPASNPIASEEVGDNEEIATSGFRSDASTDQMLKDTFRSPAPGEHIFYIKSLEWDDGGSPIVDKVYVKLTNGEIRPMNCDCRKLKATLAIPGDPNCTMMVWFRLPPSESQMEAYEYGFKDKAAAEKNPRERGGYFAKELRYFLARLGFEFDSQGRLPESAKRLANWKKYPDTDAARLIKAEVVAGKPGEYIDKKTGEKKMGKGFPNIKQMSYAFVPAPPEVAVIQQQVKLARQKATNPAPVIKTEPVAEPAADPEEKPAKHSKKPAKATA